MSKNTPRIVRTPLESYFDHHSRHLLKFSSVSAQDPKAPYYDPKDNDVSNPKWSVVHVEFRRKLKEFITLKELRDYAAKGGALENMQMLKQSRLSVSAVTKAEWDFLMGVIEEREGKESS